MFYSFLCFICHNDLVTFSCILVASGNIFVIFLFISFINKILSLYQPPHIPLEYFIYFRNTFYFTYSFHFTVYCLVVLLLSISYFLFFFSILFAYSIHFTLNISLLIVYIFCSLIHKITISIIRQKDISTLIIEFLHLSFCISKTSFTYICE